MDFDMWLNNMELNDMGKIFRLTYKILNIALEIFLPLSGAGALLFFLL
jgi:hypothetical protein